MANQWFRLYSEFANDPKIQMMSESNQRRYIMLLCIRCNGDVTLQDEEVAFQLRISNEEWATTKALFVGKGIITDDNKPTAWDKRQFASDSSAARVSKHRAKKKEQCNVTVTPQNRTDTDTEEKQKPLPEAAHPVAAVKEKVETELQTVCRKTWESYADAYELKYSTRPVRNAKVSSQVKQFVQRIGHAESVSISAWFVSHPDQFYIKNLHAFGLLLADAEKLRTQWVTGRFHESAVQAKTQYQINQDATAHAFFGNSSPKEPRLITGEVVV